MEEILHHLTWLKACSFFGYSTYQLMQDFYHLLDPKKHRKWKQPTAELVSRISSNQKTSEKHPLLHYICVSHCFPTRIHHLSGFWVEKPFETYMFFYILQIEIWQSIKSRTDALNIILEHLQTCDTMSSANHSMVTSLIEATMIIFSYRIALGLFNKTSRKWA